MLLTTLIIAAVLCLCLFAWAGIFRRLAYWMWTTPINAKLSPRWYERNKDKIEAIKARGRV